MLAGVKLIPREELIEPGEDSLSADRQKRKKDKHNQSNFHKDESSKKDQQRISKSRKKRRNESRSCLDSESNSDSSERLISSYSDKEDKTSKSRDIRSRRNKDSAKRDRADRRNGDRSSTADKKKDDEIDHITDRNNGILRKEMGLEWMLQPSHSLHRDTVQTEIEQEQQIEEDIKVNPKELNPYLQDNGSGHPSDALNLAGSSKLRSFSLVGDGGASWRLKALKRAKEQAAREGLTLQQVVGERWGSLKELATSVAVHRSAPVHAHLSAIKERQKAQTNFEETQDKPSSRHLDMKKPKPDDLQWRNKHFKRIPLRDSTLVSEAISCINQYSNDGSFMDNVINQKNKDANVDEHSLTGTKDAKKFNEKDLDFETREFDEALSIKRQALSSNQLAAKVLQLRMKGKHEEAEILSLLTWYQRLVIQIHIHLFNNLAFLPPPSTSQDGDELLCAFIRIDDTLTTIIHHHRFFQFYRNHRPSPSFCKAKQHKLHSLAISIPTYLPLSQFYVVHGWLFLSFC